MLQKEKIGFKQILPHVLAIICFLAVTMIYFSPLIEGKVLPQSDVQQYKGMSHELSDYYNNEGESSAWTGSMFSGMPAYQIGVWGGIPNFLDYLEMPLKALGGSSAGPVFTGMLMAYILFCFMGLGVVPSILGAIAYSLSSYNLIIIDAGHVTKAWAIAYLPLIVAGMVSAFNRKYLLGGLLLALGLALQIKNNHLQVTYYTGIFCMFLYAGMLVNDILSKNTKGFLKATAALALGLVVALLCNAGNIYSNYEMSKESTRGKSELTQLSKTEKQSSGLDIEYAFMWSYGKAETLSLLVPNVQGGISKPYDENSASYKAIAAEVQKRTISPENAQQLFSMVREYWGDQPSTSGPVYFGAIICFLFVMGMILIKNPMKWFILAGTIFFILLSWGRNFPEFNNWMFHHLPMYNKFRAVSMALVIPALSILMIAMWGLKEFLQGSQEKQKLQMALYISSGVTLGVCLLMFVAPGMFGFRFESPVDAQLMAYMPQDYYSAIVADRKDMFTSDVLRSLVFILLAIGVLWATLLIKGDKQKIALFATIALLILVTADLWNVDKRYLDNDKFVSALKYNVNKPFTQSNADKAILEDKQPSFRVLNMTVQDPFGEAQTSYFHKSIGGYHAAKLKRYAELIDRRLSKEIAGIQASFQSENMDSIVLSLKNNPSLNMLNAKYLIVHPEYAPVKNPYAMGNAWFVSDYAIADNADKEMDALNSIDPKTMAVVDKRFENDLSGFNFAPDSLAVIEMIAYKPNKLVYKSSAKTEQLAVFSEIYYDKGWEATVDGKPVTHFRADWTLRAMRIPAGQHEIEFRFVPHGYNTARVVASASTGILLLLLISAIAFPLFRKKE